MAAAPVEPTEEQLRGLAEATGAGEDECLAALLECGGQAEEAANRLLERPARSGAGASSASSSAAPGAARPAGGSSEEAVAEDLQATRLAEVSGCSLAQCRAALQAHSGNMDAAAAQLLQLPEDEGEEDRELDEGEAMMARQVAEVAGQSFHILQALRACGGRADDAAAYLLGLVGPEAEDAEEAEEVEPDAASDAAPTGIAETMASSPFQDHAPEAAAAAHASFELDPGGEDLEADAGAEAAPDAPDSAEVGVEQAQDPFAGVEATDVDGDSLLRLAGSEHVNAPPAKRRRSEGEGGDAGGG